MASSGVAKAAAVLLAIAAAATGAGCDIGGDGDEGAADDAQFVAELHDMPARDDDPAVGAVGLTARGAKTLVTIEVENPRGPRLQAVVQQGNCDVVGGAVVYELEPVEDGVSETVVDVPIRDLRRSGYLVMVRNPNAASIVDGICADLAQARSRDAAPTFD